MSKASQLQFRMAREPWEFELIHRLNYRTFVKEIPQHSPNCSGRLIDKFHRQNTYGICLDGMILAGMLAWRTERPFSLDQKLGCIDSYLPSGRRVCEIRLLAVEPGYRRSMVLPGLLALAAECLTGEGFDLAVISGVLRQQKLYSHLGFVPFGTPVGTAPALFQPMMVTMEQFRLRAAEWGDA